MEMPYLSGWRYRAVLLSVMGAVLGYLGFSLWAGWSEVSQAVGRVGLGGVALILSLSLFNYALRFARWQMYLRELEHPLPWWPSLRIYLAGFALTTTPGKAGEALRGVLLKPWGIPYTRSFAAFLSERLSDLLAMALLTLFGLSLYPEARPLMAIGGGLVCVALLVLSRPQLIRSWSARLPKEGGKWLQLMRHLLLSLQEAQRCHRPRVLLSATLLSSVAWAAEAVAFYGILHWMGLDLPLSFVVFAYAIAVLAGVLSFMPGGLGGTEAMMTGLLLWKSVPNVDAIAAVILIRLATLWFAVVIGLCFLVRCQKSEDPLLAKT